MDTRMNRRSLAVVAAAAAVVLGGIAVEAAPGGQPGRPVDRPTPPGRSKVAICHKGDDGLYVYKMVPKTALKGHGRHGDVMENVTGPEVCDALNVTPTPDPTETPAP